MSSPLPVATAEECTFAELTPRDFWYVACRSEELSRQAPLARTILEEDLVLFRDRDGQARALRDRCPHRAAPLSRGQREADGCLRCPYHGWVYDGAGELREVPSEALATTRQRRSGERRGGTSRRALAHEVQELDDLVFVRLAQDPARPASNRRGEMQPFRSPLYGEPGYRTVRLVNRFANSVVNCAENFIDIPHTVFVHPSIFREARDQEFVADVRTAQGEVHASFAGETNNLGWFSWFLNPDGGPIEHTDSFFMPGVTSVSYRFGAHRHFVITSQCVPVGHRDTLVFTDLTFDYGFWSRWFGPVVDAIVRYQGQKVIDQDLEILELQGRNLDKYGAGFAHSAVDVIHLYVEGIVRELENGRDPRKLPARQKQVSMWI